MAESIVSLEAQWQTLGDHQGRPGRLIEIDVPDEEQIVRAHRISQRSLSHRDKTPLERAIYQLDNSGMSSNPYTAEPISTTYAEERDEAEVCRTYLDQIQSGLGRSFLTVTKRFAALHHEENTGLVTDANTELREGKVKYWLAYRQATDPNAESLFLSRLVGFEPSAEAPVGPEPVVSGMDGVEGRLPGFIHATVYRQFEVLVTGEAPYRPAFDERKHAVVPDPTV